MNHTLRRASLVSAVLVASATIAATPALAQPKDASTKTCSDGTVLFTTNGQSVWASSGDAKYQLIAVDGSGIGTFYDKKTDTTQPFSETISQTWGSGQDADFVCSGTDHIEWTSGPHKGSSFDLSFTAQFREV